MALSETLGICAPESLVDDVCHLMMCFESSYPNEIMLRVGYQKSGTSYGVRIIHCSPEWLQGITSIASGQGTLTEPQWNAEGQVDMVKANNALANIAFYQFSEDGYTIPSGKVILGANVGLSWANELGLSKIPETNSE